MGSEDRSIRLSEGKYVGEQVVHNPIHAHPWRHGRKIWFDGMTGADNNFQWKPRALGDPVRKQ